MGLERFEELDDLFLLDAAFVHSEQVVRAGQPGDDRDVSPVQMELDDGRLPLGCPGAHPRGPLAEARLVHKDDQPAFSLGFFLRAGQVLRFQLRTASSLRSMARFSGFWELKPSEPRIRQMCAWLKRTACMRSMTTPTRLRVHRSVPNPCSVGPCNSAARTLASCAWSSCAGRPRSGTARKASMPPSSSNAFHVYTVWRATPTASATSAQPLPFCSIRPARSRFFAASHNRFSTIQNLSKNKPEDITHGQHNGCHVFREDQ